MKNSTLILSGLITVVTGFSVSSANAATVFFEDFSSYTGVYSGGTPMTSNWTQVNGGTVNNEIVTEDPSLEVPYLDLGSNPVWSTSLPGTVTEDFSLTAKVLHTDYSRILWFGLFDPAGTNGYVAYWSSNLSTQFDSEGAVRLKQYTATEVSDITYNFSGTNLTVSAAKSGHNSGNTTSAAISAPFATITLSWEAETSMLSLYVDGDLKLAATDADISSFANLYIGGSTGSRFTDIQLTTVPESSSSTLIMVLLSGALVLALRKRISRRG